MAVAQLNFHHLRYFWAIAHEGSLTRAASKLHVSQSALSIQLKQLEHQLGHPLFERANRALKLTEAGRIALAYADSIFRTGEELRSTLAQTTGGARRVLRVGSVATLSRNFQFGFLEPLLAERDVELVVRSGSERELLQQLRAHTIDIVLSNHPVRRDSELEWHSHLPGEQCASLVSRPVSSSSGRGGKLRAMSLPQDLDGARVVLPSVGNELRAGFDRLVEASGVAPTVVAEVDDMAMLRLFARSTDALTLLPAVVVRDELQNGSLQERCRIDTLVERFYAITPSRRFPNPLVRDLLNAFKPLD